MKKHIIFIPALLAVLWITGTAFGAIIVGRIAHVEGEVYRYLDGEQIWVETVADAPAGLDDILTTGENSRAEIAFPNNMLIRLAQTAEMEVLELQLNTGIFALHTGLARFANQNSAAGLQVETIHGTAKIEPGGVLDIQVTDHAVRVSSVRGEAVFLPTINGNERQEIISGSTTLEFSQDGIIAGLARIDWNWDRWNEARDALRVRNRLVRSQYLPETMQEYASVLEPYGKWRRIHYGGYYYWAWQPTPVSSGWAPYSTGYWYDWRDEPVWIDHNPWGWVTHHHGHWLRMHGAWMWTPYVHVTSVPGVTVVGLNINFGRNYRPHWHPGRVRWISHSSHIGWLPLAPGETYYGYRRWGPRSVMVQRGSRLNITVNLADHRYADHAVIIPKERFYNRGPRAVHNYSTVKIKNIDRRRLVRNYRPAPLLEERRPWRSAAKITRIPRKIQRPAARPAERAVRIRETGGRTLQLKRAAPADNRPRMEQRQRTVSRGVPGPAGKPGVPNLKSRAPGVEKNISGRMQAVTRKSSGRRTAGRHDSSVSETEVSANKARKSKDFVVSASPRKTELPGPDRPRAGSRLQVVRDKTTAAPALNSVREPKQIRRQKPQMRRQAAPDYARNRKGPPETDREYSRKDRRDDGRDERLTESPRNRGPQKERIGRRGKAQQTDRNFFSSALNNRPPR